MPPLPGPDWLRPAYGDLQPLAVQSVDPRIFAALGITARQGYSPILLPTVQPVVVLPLEEEAASGTPGASDVAFFGGEARTPVSQAHLQLWNPVGSGVNVFIDRIRAAPGTAAFLELRHNAAQLTTLTGQGTPKAVGGSGSAAELRYQDAGSIGTFILQFMFNSNTESPNLDWHNDPIALSPGRGIIVRNSTGGSVLRILWEWRERIIVA